MAPKRTVQRLDPGIVAVYGLADPRDHTIHYIGATRTPHNRLQGHQSAARHRSFAGKALVDWICSLSQDNEEPEMVILELVPDHLSHEAEARWIERCCRESPSLCNQAAPYDRNRPKRPPPKSPPPRSSMTAEELIAVRREHGLSQQALATMLGVHYSTVSRWEAGERRIPMTVQRLVGTLLPDG